MTEVPTLTYGEAVMILTAVVEQEGRDYVNPKFDDPVDVLPTCLYFTEDGCASCGVGRVLAAKGVMADQLSEHQNTLCARTLFRELTEAGIINVTVDAGTLLSRFQYIQDGAVGNTWGEALDYALEHIPR